MPLLPSSVVEVGKAPDDSSSGKPSDGSTFRSHLRTELDGPRPYAPIYVDDIQSEDEDDDEVGAAMADAWEEASPDVWTRRSTLQKRVGGTSNGPLGPRRLGQLRRPSASDESRGLRFREAVVPPQATKPLPPHHWRSANGASSPGRKKSGLRQSCSEDAEEEDGYDEDEEEESTQLRRRRRSSGYGTEGNIVGGRGRATSSSGFHGGLVLPCRPSRQTVECDGTDEEETVRIIDDIQEASKAMSSGGNGSSNNAEPSVHRVYEFRCDPKAATHSSEKDRSSWSSGMLPSPALCVDGGPQTRMQQITEENRKWKQRQDLTGTVSRLVVYEEHERPREDIRIRGGCGSPLVVTSVLRAGKAFKAGVKMGDRLVSVNGDKELCQLPAAMLQDQLQAPVSLVFVGFVGGLCAEVRISCPSTQQLRCGMETGFKLMSARHAERLLLCEERVFNPGLGSLFLSVEPDCHPSVIGLGRDESGYSLTELPDEEIPDVLVIDSDEDDSESKGLLELHRKDARQLLDRVGRVDNKKPWFKEL